MQFSTFKVRSRVFLRSALFKIQLQEVFSPCDTAYSVGGDARGRVKTQIYSHFPVGPRNSSQTKVLSCMDNTGHTAGGDEGFGGQSFLSQLQAQRPGEERETGHLIPTPGPVMGKWKSHREKREVGGFPEDRGKRK